MLQTVSSHQTASNRSQKYCKIFLLFDPGIFRNMLVSALRMLDDAKLQFRPRRASIRAQGDSSRLSSYLDRISGSEYACSFLSSELVGSPVSGASIALDIASCGFIGYFFSKFPFFAPSHALFNLARGGRCVIIFSLSVDLFSFRL